MKPLPILTALPVGSHLAIIGCGGKTTLMNALGAHYSQSHPVLIGTTTLVMETEVGHPRFIPQEQAAGFWPDANGVYLSGVPVNGTPKIGGLPAEEMKPLAGRFPYSFLESDGSRERPLKGWADYEPVVSPFTTHTVGVVNLTALGQPASPDNVHRPPLFTALTGCQMGQTVTLEHLARMLDGAGGMFAKARGKQMVFVSHVDGPEDMATARQLVDHLQPEFKEKTTLLAGNGPELQGELLWRSQHDQ